MSIRSGKAPLLNFKHADTRFLVAAMLGVGLIALSGFLFFKDAAFLMTLIAVMLVILGRQTHLYRTRQDQDTQQLKHIQSLLWLYAQIPFQAPLPALTGWAASPQLACTVYELTRSLRPRLVVELGSGVSTILVGYALDKNDAGRILSLDHDAEFGALTRQRLNAHGLSHRATVLPAPLQATLLESATYQWYNLDALDIDQPIDLLIIDGPPSKTNQMTRYPALPMLFNHLSKTAVIVLDDASRASEAATVQRWMTTYADLTLEHVDSPKGITVLRRSPYPAPST